MTSVVRRLREAAPAPLRQLARALKRLRRRRAPRRGSFAALVDDRRTWLFDTLPHESAAYHYELFGKESQKRLARRLGLDVADDYLMRVPLGDAITYARRERLDAFVIKPNSSHSSLGCRGVLTVDGALVDLRTRAPVTLEALQTELRREVEHLDRPDEWVLEELLLPVDGSRSVIEDYKCYCFGGRVEIIAHKRPILGTKEYESQIFTRDWTPVDVGLVDTNVGRAAAPLRGARLVDVAERAASALCYPFIRVDLYDTTRGIVLGEFTPGPGRRDDFNAEWDARLTTRWHEAAAEIEERIRSGRLVPLVPE